MTDSPQFETRPGPRPRSAKLSKYDAVAGYMREHPGTWVKVRTAPTDPAAWSAAQQIKQGRRAAFRPASDFEVYTEGRDVVARYVGDGTPDCPECHGHVSRGSYCPACGLSNHGEPA